MSAAVGRRFDLYEERFPQASGLWETEVSAVPTLSLWLATRSSVLYSYFGLVIKLIRMHNDLIK